MVVAGTGTGQILAMGVLPPPVTTLSGSDLESLGGEARWIADGFLLVIDFLKLAFASVLSVLCSFGAWCLLNPKPAGQAPPAPTPKPTAKSKSKAKAAAKGKGLAKPKKVMKRPAAALKSDTEVPGDEAVEEAGEPVTVKNDNEKASKKSKNEKAAAESANSAADTCPPAEVPSDSSGAARKKPASAKGKAAAKASHVMHRPASSAAAAAARGSSGPGRPLLQLQDLAACFYCPCAGGRSVSSVYYYGEKRGIFGVKVNGKEAFAAIH